MPSPIPQSLRLPALLAGALLCASLVNALARPERRLNWFGREVPAAQALPALPPPSVEPPPLPQEQIAPAASARTPAAPTQAAPKPAAPKPAAPMQAAPKPAPGPSLASRFPPDPAAVTREISSADALAAFQLHAPFLDARRSAEFAEAHVAGAWSAPVWESTVDARITEFEARANPSPKAPIVLYCGGGGCADSHLLARKLEALGYRNLLVYRDGFPDWQAQARPIAKGARP